jgi:hypothetical protein
MNKLVHILSTAITPEILQSDNGNKFMGGCIKIITQFYDFIHIVKERAYHPESPDKIERDHATFKESLQNGWRSMVTTW